ncbi:hypothetical protein ACVWWN_003421 [Mycobacterium sp. URHB0021]
MELRQLEYFIAVAGEMNFSRAAQRAHVVQSALSTSVAKLEKELGVDLFDRSRQQIRITPAREHGRGTTLLDVYPCWRDRTAACVDGEVDRVSPDELAVGGRVDLDDVVVIGDFGGRLAECFR